MNERCASPKVAVVAAGDRKRYFSAWSRFGSKSERLQVAARPASRREPLEVLTLWLLLSTIAYIHTATAFQRRWMHPDFVQRERRRQLLQPVHAFPTRSCANAIPLLRILLHFAQRSFNHQLRRRRRLPFARRQSQPVPQTHVQAQLVSSAPARSDRSCTRR